MFNLKKILAAGAACLMMSLPFFAVNASAHDARVADNAGLLTDVQLSALSNKIDEEMSKSGTDIMIVTDESTYGMSSQAYADKLEEDMVLDSKEGGILLFIGLENRDVAISASGKAMKTFPDSECNEIRNDITPYLSDSNYNLAFSRFVDDVSKSYSKAFIKKILITVGVGVGAGLIIALIVVLVFKSQLKSVVFQRNANVYEVPGSLNVRRSHDMFLYRTVTKRAKPKNDSNGGHTSSSGTSHTGSSGHF